MTEKIRVSHEVAEAIEFQLTRRSPEELLTRVIEHKEFGGSFVLRSKVLNALSISEIARILYVGYEVEETPEEKWSRRYKQTVDCLAFPIADDVRDLLEKEKRTIESMVRDFGLKIEGVNAN